MFKIKQAPKNTVSDILADFRGKVAELKGLQERKAQEVTDTEIQIQTLQAQAAAAKDEALKASKAADKIAQFLAE